MLIRPIIRRWINPMSWHNFHHWLIEGNRWETQETFTMAWLADKSIMVFIVSLHPGNFTVLKLTCFQVQVISSIDKILDFEMMRLKGSSSKFMRAMYIRYQPWNIRQPNSKVIDQAFFFSDRLGRSNEVTISKMME